MSNGCNERPPLTITGKHSALGLRTLAEPDGGGPHRCTQIARIDQLIADVEQARVDILVIDTRTEKTLELVKELHARNHDAAIEERVLSEVETAAKAVREASRVAARDRADRFKTIFEVVKTVAPWIAFAVMWVLSRH